MKYGITEPLKIADSRALEGRLDADRFSNAVYWLDKVAEDLSKKLIRDGKGGDSTAILHPLDESWSGLLDATSRWTSFLFVVDKAEVENGAEVPKYPYPSERVKNIDRSIAASEALLAESIIYKLRKCEEFADKQISVSAHVSRVMHGCADDNTLAELTCVYATLLVHD